MVYLLFLLVSSAAMAADEGACRTIDHSERLGEVRDQGYIGSCYAQSAADLVTFETGKRTSAAQIAMMSSTGEASQAYVVRDERTRKRFGCRPAVDPKRSITYLEGGWVSDAIEETQKVGFCEEAAFPSSEGDFKLYTSTVDSFRADRKSCDRHFELHTFETIEKLSQAAPLNAIFKTLAQSCVSPVEGRFATNVIFQETSIVGDATDALNGVQPRTFRSAERITAQSHSLLEKGRIGAVSLQPVESLLKSSWLERFRGVRDQCDLYKAVMFGGPHVMTLVGREYNSKTKTCDFKLRNSWGKDCKMFRSDVRCKNGYIWLSEQDLKKVTTSLEWIGRDL